MCRDWPQAIASGISELENILLKKQRTSPKAFIDGKLLTPVRV